MNTETIEAALRRMPSDERIYDEPLAALVAGNGVRLGRPAARTRPRLNALPMLAAIAVVLVVGTAAAIVGLTRGPSTGPGGSPATYGLIGCYGGGPAFSRDLLTSGDSSAETAQTAPAAALRALLVGQGSSLPASGWRLISQNDNAATFVGTDAKYGGWASVTVTRGEPTGAGIGAQGWHADSWGSCNLMAVAPAGYNIASWTLDPAFTYSAGSTELHVLVEEMSCASGLSAEGRITAQAVYGAGTVTVTAFTATQEGAQTCQGNPATPYLVHLSQPVGAATLLDGGPYPAEVRAGSGQGPTPSVPVSVPSAGCSTQAEAGKGCIRPPGSTYGAVASNPLAPDATFIQYTVRSGDTVATIAMRFNVPLSALLAANPQLAANPNHIEPGQVLNIPAPAAT
jgi:hypothetical protein